MVQPALVHCSLPDQDCHAFEMLFDQLIWCAGSPMRDNFAHTVQFGSAIGRIDHRLVARKGIHEDQRSCHFIPDDAMPVVMNFCRNAKTSVTGISVTTVMARI